MKTALTSLFLLASLSTHASYFEDNCSNGDGTARWETGHNNNEIYLKVVSDETGETSNHTFSTEDLKIKYSKKKTLGKRTEVHDQCSSSDHDYSSAFATVTPKKKIRADFKKLFKSGKVTDWVVCHEVIGGEDPDCVQK